MADTDTTEQGTTDPQDADPESNGEGQTPEPGVPEGEQETGGKGSKESVLADLARERKDRQTYQQQATESSEKLTSVLSALGIKSDGETEVDPEALSADLQSQKAENAVLRAGHGVADVDALLDSKNFTDSLSKVDVADRAAVKAHIESYVDNHPRFGATPQTPAGVRDAAAGREPEPTGSGDWLRNTIRGK